MHVYTHSKVYGACSLCGNKRDHSVHLIKEVSLPAKNYETSFGDPEPMDEQLKLPFDFSLRRPE